MQEYWFCSECKSMNRAAASRCYSCRAPRAGHVLATRVERQEGAVLTPGLDEQHRAVAWTLMAHRTYISAWPLGYLAAVMLALVMPIMVFLGIVLARASMESGDWSSLTASSWYPALVGMAVYVLLTVVVHSLFLGLASMDAPALGSGTARFLPVRAAFWWIESVLWATRAGLAFIVPPMLSIFAIGLGGGLYALIPGLGWMWVAYMFLGDPISSLSKPARLLADLHVRSGVRGSADSRIVSWWALSWGAAQAIVYVVAVLLYLLLAGLILVAMVGVDLEALESNSDPRLAATLLVYFIALSQAIAEGLSMGLLAVITWQIASGQRIREAWVRSGSRGPQGPRPNVIASPAGPMPAGPMPAGPAGPTNANGPSAGGPAGAA